MDYSFSNGEYLNFANKNQISSNFDTKKTAESSGYSDPAANNIFSTNPIDQSQEDIYEEYVEWKEDSINCIEEGRFDDVEQFDYVRSDVSYKDANFMTPWKEGVENLASKDMEAHDTDKSGGLSWGEFIEEELNEWNKLYGDDLPLEYDEVTNVVNGEFSDIFNDVLKKSFDSLDYDNSGEIEVDELESYYAALDSMDSKNGSIDGKIQISELINLDTTSDTFQTRFGNAMNIFGEQNEQN